LILSEALAQRYRLVTMNKTCCEASAYCRDRNAELVAIDDKAEQDALETYLKDIAIKGQFLQCSDVKRGQNLEAEAEAEAEAETNFWRFRPKPRPKIIMKKVPNNDDNIRINNIRFKIIARQN